MKTFKRILTLLMALVMVFTMLPLQAMATETEPETSVDTGDLKVEGTNGFGNLLSQEIQEASDELEEDYEAGYSVIDLTFEGSTATVEYSSLEEAIMVVAVYSEDGLKMLASGSVQVSPDEDLATVIIEGDMPEYFLAFAYLMDTYDLSPLCAAYDTPMYTREMQELLASTVDDYDPEKVLNLDEDASTNFAVFAEGVFMIEPVEGINTVTSADGDNLVYVIENVNSSITELEKDSIFVYPYGEEILIVKVASMSVENGIATIQGAELDMDEVFSHVKIESVADPEHAEVEEDSGIEAVRYLGRIDPDHTMHINGDDGSDSASKSFTFSVFYESDKNSNGDSVRVKGELALNLGAAFSFHKAGWRSHVRLQIDTTIDLGISITGRFTNNFWNKDIPLKDITLPFRLGCIKDEDRT